MTGKADTYKAIADYFTGLGTLFEVLAADSASGPERPAGPVAAAPSAAPASTFSDGTPVEEPYAGELEPFDQPEPIRRQSQDSVLGECPVHFRPWTVKEGGISKAGKPYAAFWKCSGKNQDGTYCSKKPVKAWADSHPAEAAA